MADPSKLVRVAALGATVVVMVAVRAVLRVAPGLLVRWGSATRPAQESSTTPISTTAGNLAALVDRAAWYVSATCLERALTLLLIIRFLHPSCGGARLLLGVALTGSGLRAHAWVEAPGGVLLGSADDNPAPLLPRSAWSARDV